jgi:hypothetical protein
LNLFSYSIEHRFKSERDISINSAYKTLKEAKQEHYGLIYRKKKDKEKYDGMLSGEKPPDYKEISKNYLRNMIDYK